MHPVAIVCTATLGLLLFGLGVAVSVQRLRDRRGLGLPDDPASALGTYVFGAALCIALLARI